MTWTPRQLAAQPAALPAGLPAALPTAVRRFGVVGKAFQKAAEVRGTPGAPAPRTAKR